MYNRAIKANIIVRWSDTARGGSHVADCMLLTVCFATVFGFCHPLYSELLPTGFHRLVVMVRGWCRDLNDCDVMWSPLIFRWK